MVIRESPFWHEGLHLLSCFLQDHVLHGLCIDLENLCRQTAIYFDLSYPMEYNEIGTCAKIMLKFLIGHSIS